MKCDPFLFCFMESGVFLQKKNLHNAAAGYHTSQPSLEARIMFRAVLKVTR